MELTVFAAIMLAAVMHASWNALVKTGLDRFSSIILMSLFQGGIAIALAAFFPLPAAAAWPWIIASGLVHVFYKLFLIRAYQAGDLSQVYPLARGSAPLIVALVGAAFLGEGLTPLKVAGVVWIAIGVMLMAKRGGKSLDKLPGDALFFALCTAGFTASYTLIDGLGGRLSGTASGYTMWIFAIDGLLMCLYALARRGRSAFAPLRATWRSGITAGALSLGSYWIAIWAMTKAPIALVAALRETSVLFAMLIGTLLLKENAGIWRWAAALIMGAGVLLVRL